MKKMLFFTAMSAIALTSCVNDEVFSDERGQELSNILRFDAPAMQQTRANVYGEISGVKYPEDENFMVLSKHYDVNSNFAGWTNGTEDFFAANGEEAKGGHTVGTSKYWATDIAHVWPDNQNLAFAAYSPATFTTPAEAILHTANGFQITGFQTEANADKQYDLMYSNRVYDLNKGNNANTSVKLVFNHALTSIVFSSQKADDYVDYEITKLVLTGNFIQKANFSQNITENNVGGTYSETEAPAWSDFAAASPAEYIPSFPSFSVPSATPAQFTQGESALLLIPQAVPDDAAVEITYTKDGIESTATIKLSAFSYTKDGVTYNITNWERGKRYVYRIAFGENSRIYFEPSITDWIQEPTLIYTISNK